MTFFLVMALSWQMPAFSCEVGDTTRRWSDDYTVSLITCYPGEEIYELCGHSAIRVKGGGTDSIWNYGIFDFNQPNFVYRFVKGETDYKGAAYPFNWFLPEYIHSGRRVVEQELNLSPEEKESLIKILRNSVLPENAEYRYNYTKDNCSIRILNHLDTATNSQIIYPDTVRYGTFRNEMRSYHRKYPWYQFGIDLALGSGLDQKTNSREEMFVPLELMHNAASAEFTDGRPLVKATYILNEGTGDATLDTTPWFLAPLFWAWIVTLMILAVVAHDIINQKLFLPVYSVWFTLLGLAGCLVAFLVFISVHEATSPNILILWLNPLQFLFVISVYTPHLRILSKTMAWYNIGVVGGLLFFYPMLTQSFNPAFFPLMGATVALSGSYAIIVNKLSYRKR